MSSSSPIDPAALWRARVEMLGQERWSFALTLAYNDWPISRDRMRRDLRALHCIVDRNLFGTRFHRLPASERTRFVAFVEGEDHHPHLHAGWRVPGGRRLMDFVRLWKVDHIWSRIAPRGSFEIRIPEPGRGWWSYCTKHTTADSEWISSDEFLPADAFAAPS
ncbi:hypothetical protein GCM10011504_37810 [Siccirubricoccus deserti]|nr:hypothetical protein GCM10011504_37810 [Siccirubricoccus deserti]